MCKLFPLFFFFSQTNSLSLSCEPEEHGHVQMCPLGSQGGQMARTVTQANFFFFLTQFVFPGQEWDNAGTENCHYPHHMLATEGPFLFEL